MTQRLWLTAVVLGLIVTALFWIDPIIIPLAFIGPLVWGGFAGSQSGIVAEIVEMVFRFTSSLSASACGLSTCP